MRLNTAGKLSSGTPGKLIADLGNGFATFQQPNGHTYTVHSVEFLEDSAPANTRRDFVKHVPVGSFSIRVAVVGGAKQLIVQSLAARAGA